MASRVSCGMASKSSFERPTPAEPAPFVASQPPSRVAFGSSRAGGSGFAGAWRRRTRSRRRLRSPPSPSRSSSESSARTLRRRTMAPQKRGGRATVRYAFEGPRPRAFTPSSSAILAEIFVTGRAEGRCTRRRHAARAKLDRRARARGPRRRREAVGRGSRRNRRDARGREGHRTRWRARELRAGEGRAGDQVPRDPGQPQRGASLRHARAWGFRATALGK